MSSLLVALLMFQIPMGSTYVPPGAIAPTTFPANVLTLEPGSTVLLLANHPTILSSSQATQTSSVLPAPAITLMPGQTFLLTPNHPTILE